MKRNKQLSIRLKDNEWERLQAVQEHIKTNARGMEPEIADMVRSLIGFGNPNLITQDERNYLAGLTDELPALGSEGYHGSLSPDGPRRSSDKVTSYKAGKKRIRN